MRMGIDLGGTKIEGAVLDDSGKIVWRERVVTPAHDYDAVVTEIQKLVSAMVADNTLPEDLPIGIGTPGVYSASTGLMRNCNSVYLNGRDFPGDLRQALQREVRIANDANCFTLSEAVSGAATEAKVVFGVILGTGAGGGLVVDKQVVSGVNGSCGEWGHNPLIRQTVINTGEVEENFNNRHCYCGRQNCVETFLSGTGLQTSYFLHTGSSRFAADIYQAAQQGEKQAVFVYTAFLQQLARNLAIIVNILDPDVIVFGGGLSNMKNLYERIPQLWSPYIFSESIETKLVKAVHGDSSGVIGAAWL